MERYIKLCVVRAAIRGKMLLMDRRDAYLLKAAELTALAENSRYTALKRHFENLAFAYLRLAELAKHNDDLDLVYETPTPVEDADHR
jgi:hypothetical protein